MTAQWPGRTCLSVLAATTLAVGLLAGCSARNADSHAANISSPTSVDKAALLEKALKEQAAGNTDAAGKSFRALLREDPKNKFAFYNLGVLAHQAGDAATAMSDYKQALTIDPAYEPALYNLAILTDNAGDAKGAVALYRNAIKADPTDGGAHFNLGLLLQRLGDQAGAVKEINTAIKLDPAFKARLAKSSKTP